MSSRVIVAHWQIKAGKREELLSVLYQLVAEIKANEPGCLGFEINQEKDQPDKLMLFETYKDEAAIKAHSETPHFQKYIGQVTPLLENRVRTYYEKLDRWSRE